MKIAPLYHALNSESWAQPFIVHTGQHYDLNMSDVFFSDLRLPEPHFHLEVGSGSHAEQTGKVMMVYEKIVQEEKPDMVIVVGDVNSTLACALAVVKMVFLKGDSPMDRRAEKLGFGFQRPLIAHLEAGLRSFDRSMPEEINRVATDGLADILWTPSVDGDVNLLKEGIPKDRIERVGNIMIDSLEMMRETIDQQVAYKKYGLSANCYGVVTFHRPATVDNLHSLSSLVSVLLEISNQIPLIFPVHPRTRRNLEHYRLLQILSSAENIILSEPLNYPRFMSLVCNCRVVITDSGGIQEETTYLGIPCLTMRPNTERPITITEGTNRLCSVTDLQEQFNLVMSRRNSAHKVPELWDGKTADRVVACIKQLRS